MGFLSNIFGKGNTTDPNWLRQQAVQPFKDLRVPEVKEMYVQLQELVSQGEITPEQAVAYLQQESELKGIQVDPEFLNTAIEEMRYLKDIGAQGGMTAQMRQRLQEARDLQEGEARSRTRAIVESAQARGVGGSGIELGERLIAEQEAANRAARTGTQAAADAEQRALQAIIGAGSLGRELQSQRFGQEAQVASAQDVINRFNVQAAQNVEEANRAAREKAGYYNRAEAQRIADANVAAKNLEAQRRAGLVQQRFGNMLSKATGEAGQYSGWAEQDAKRRSEMEAASLGFWSGILGAGTTLGAAAIGGGQAPDAAGAAATAASVMV